jgi:hypothetical protein
MAAKLLLYVSAEQATAAIWRSNRLTAIQRFDNHQEGWAAFGAYLRSAGGLLARLMVDTIDEDYRFEILPHATGRDRAQLLTRKMRQLYRATPFTAWSHQERATGKRREDRYLFVAMNDPEVLAPWLRALESARVPVAGIYPVPMVTLLLIERMKLKQPHLLFVSKNTAGLRQTFCRNLKFRISRLTAHPETSEPADAFYAEEIGNTRMYLDALTVTHVDDIVSVHILDHDETLSGLADALGRGRPNLECVRLGREEIARRLSIPIDDLKGSPDTMHLHLLARGVPAIDLAPAQVEIGFQLYRVRRYVYAAAASCLLAAFLWAAVNQFRTYSAEDDIVALGQQVQQYQARYREVTTQFPKAPASAEELLETVKVAERIRGEQRTPEGMLLVVSRALDYSPDIVLKKVQWRYGDPVKLHDSAASSPSGAATAGGQPRQAGLISAEVTRVAQDHRAVLDQIQSFVGLLAADPKVEQVRVIKLPMDVTSASALTGTTAESERPPQAQFELAIVFKAGV